MDEKQKLRVDIEKLLNSYDDQDRTSIDPAMLEFLDEQTLKSIISSLLKQKESCVESNSEWLEQFKKY